MIIFLYKLLLRCREAQYSLEKRLMQRGESRAVCTVPVGESAPDAEKPFRGGALASFLTALCKRCSENGRLQLSERG